MNRRAFVTSLGALLAAPLAARAQQAGKVARMGFLSLLSASNPFPPRGPFLQGLRDLGWIEGKNITIEWRFADGVAEKLPALADQLVQQRVDVIFTETTAAALAAKRATTTIPIVFNAVADPIGSGVVSDLARPGGNITGWSFLGAELTRKRFEFLKEAVPALTRVALLVQPGVPSEATVKSILKDVQTAAQSSGVSLQRFDVQGPQDFEKVFPTMSREKIGGLILVPSPMFLDQRQRLGDLATRHRLPAVFFFREFVEAGGLMSYGANFHELGRRAATYVDKILKGTKPSDLPVQQPTEFALVINLRAATALGLTIPQSLLLRADQVIE
jgi:putative tryptophan/tyrosine transport system substrate-binding protein